MDELIKAEFDRVNDENQRQNKRLEKLEMLIDQINCIVIEMQKLSINMERVMEEMQKQGKRLEKIEEEPAEAWKKFKATTFNEATKLLVSAAIGALIVLASKGI